MLLRLKIHVFCLVIHPDKQTNVNHLAFLHRVINIRYLFIFQIEKIFCPKFLLKARTADKRKSKEFAAWNVKKQQDYCSVGIYEKESGLYDTKVVFANRFISIVYVLNGRKVIT